MKAKGTIFAIGYLIWKILHHGVRYEERRPAVSDEAKKVPRHDHTTRRPLSNPTRNNTIATTNKTWMNAPIV